MMTLIERLLANFSSLSSFSFSGFSGVGPGWLFGVFGALALSLFSLSIGRTKVVISLLSIYIAFAFERLFPYIDNLGSLSAGKIEIHWFQIGLFVIAYLIAFLIFNLSFIRKRVSSQDYSLFGILVLSIAQFGFLASIVLNMLPKEIALQWSFGFHNYFVTSTALFFWALTPLPILAFIRK